MLTPPSPPRNHFTIPRSPPGPRVEPIFHDRLPQGDADAPRRSGTVTLEIEALGPVHVGSGGFSLGEDGRAVKEIARLGGVPILPGSGLKGACRAMFEALTGSRQATAEGHIPKYGLCSPAAGLFGGLGLMGRVSFDDAFPAGDLVAQRISISVAYPPRNSTRGYYRLYGDLPAHSQPPRVIPAFAIPPGAVLNTDLRLRNVSRQDLGALFLSLGIGRFAPRPGGAKYDGLGRVRITAVGFRLHTGLKGTCWVSGDAAEVNQLVEDCIHRCGLEQSQAATLATLAAELSLPRTSGGG